MLTVPAGRVFLVKRIFLARTSGSGTNQVEVRAVGTGAANQYFFRSVTWSNPQDIDTWFVLEPGQELHAIADTTGARISVHGADLAA